MDIAPPALHLRRRLDRLHRRGVAARGTRAARLDDLNRERRDDARDDRGAGLGAGGAGSGRGGHRATESCGRERHGRLTLAYGGAAGWRHARALGGSAQQCQKVLRRLHNEYLDALAGGGVEGSEQHHWDLTRRASLITSIEGGDLDQSGPEDTPLLWGRHLG